MWPLCSLCQNGYHSTQSPCLDFDILALNDMPFKQLQRQNVKHHLLMATNAACIKQVVSHGDGTSTRSGSRCPTQHWCLAKKTLGGKLGYMVVLRVFNGLATSCHRFNSASLSQTDTKCRQTTCSVDQTDQHISIVNACLTRQLTSCHCKLAMGSSACYYRIDVWPCL